MDSSAVDVSAKDSNSITEALRLVSSVPSPGWVRRKKVLRRVPVPAPKALPGSRLPAFATHPPVFQSPDRFLRLAAAKPARATEDLPLPEAPTIARKRLTG
jgi:hypothetical protein